jgi:hypothetical protein
VTNLSSTNLVLVSSTNRPQASAQDLAPQVKDSLTRLGNLAEVLQEASVDIISSVLDSLEKEIRAKEEALLVENAKRLRTSAGKGISLDQAINRGLVRFRHGGSYRSEDELNQKKGNQYGPFSRKFWVDVRDDSNRTLVQGDEAGWVIHVHYKTTDPAQQNPPRIDRAHAKRKDTEFAHEFQAIWFPAMANAMVIFPVLNNAISKQKDQAAPPPSNRPENSVQDFRSLGT